MLLSEAYLLWQKEPENMALYRNTKDAFRLTWLMLPTNKPCAYYTKDVLADAMVKTKTMHDFRVKAGSVMVHVLIYAHKKNSDNPMPAFSYNEVLLMVKEMEDKANKPQKEDDDEKDPLEGIDFKDPEPCDEHGDALPATDNPKNETDMKKKKETKTAAKPRGKLPRPVAQIDPETLQVVKVWPSCSEAERETSARNLTRVIKRKNISGGFFWCYPEDAKGFKPNPYSKPALVKEAEKKETQQKRKAEVYVTSNDETLGNVSILNAEKVFSSGDEIEEGTDILICAAPTEGNKLLKWSNGSTENPMLIETTGDPINIVGIFTKDESAPRHLPHPEHIHINKPSPLLKSLADFTDAELIHELEQRGWKGDLQLMLKVSLKPKED